MHLVQRQVEPCREYPNETNTSAAVMRKKARSLELSACKLSKATTRSEDRRFSQCQRWTQMTRQLLALSSDMKALTIEVQAAMGNMEKDGNSDHRLSLFVSFQYSTTGPLRVHQHLRRGIRYLADQSLRVDLVSQHPLRLWHIGHSPNVRSLNVLRSTRWSSQLSFAGISNSDGGL